MGFKALLSRTAFFRQHAERTPIERDLVRRLDIFLMTFGCVSQVIKYLDQTNISSAYVSGMKEDLNLQGNELNYFTTWFSVSYCIMLIPSQVIMTWVRPSWWLPGLEIGWGIITGLIALCHNAKQIYVLRVFLGLFESSAWPGMMTLFMYWYTPTELAKRMGFYHSCQTIGSMMSGALQTAMLNTLDGHHGIAGWRWLFVINAIMTVAVGFAGFFMLPDYPSSPNPRAFWFTGEHARIAQERLERHGQAGVKKITWAAAKRTASMWIAYFIPILYIGTVLAQYGINYFNLFLKSLLNPDGSRTWSTSQVNTIPIAGGAINVAFVWIWAIASDILQTRWTLLVAQAVIGLVVSIIMSVWAQQPNTTPLSAAYASYFILYTCQGTAPLIFSWLADLVPQDPEARTLVVGYAIAGLYSIIAWSQVLVWPASEAPHYRYAWPVSVALWVLVAVMVVVLRVVDLKYLLPKRFIATTPAIDAAKLDGEEDVVADTTGKQANSKTTDAGAGV
ncbi:major facilitator superfamily transporter [Diaporthe helianthi]|uniref:Major facilitator superfamily transporter n=1 Tax=Diaporthe helianthi TaxID=158607 RepID=A0A2P5HIA7_DIAHE|nr:major facilitator superfamily transporter [Diaporthe helianthi]